MYGPPPPPKPRDIKIFGNKESKVAIDLTEVVAISTSAAGGCIVTMRGGGNVLVQASFDELGKAVWGT